jgi:nicotinic acid mononucleotide adenylyltransferase
MDNSLYLKLHSNISNYVLNTKFLKRIGLSSEVVEEFLNSSTLLDNLSDAIHSNDYSCRRTFTLCKDFLSRFLEEDLDDDFLQYVYGYTLHKAFPHATSISLTNKLDRACKFYLRVLRIVLSYQKDNLDNSWQSKYPLKFLNSNEENNLENPIEYKSFIKAFNDEYVYEMMKLSQEVKGFTTLDHVCGVHYLALTIARSLKSSGLPVDLGRVSGSAAGHDIGKFGCTPGEVKRVPYLHYYYTDKWFKKHHIHYIGHIAVNHSTWDLELENLSLESLVLIYADFRVKSLTTNNKTEMYIYSLKEAFDVILNKLDNVDEAKERRYRRVYAKLKDFEDLLINLGVNIDPHISDDNQNIKIKRSNYSLLQGADIIQNIKYLSINHNINLMYKLRDESALNTILELARSEKDWRNLREYLNIFEEYSTHLTQKQKLITLKFLYDQLTHPEDDIRRQVAELIGTLIATFDEDYRKEIPENAKIIPPQITSCELLDKYLDLFISPNYKIIPEHQTWIGYSLSIMIGSLFWYCHDNQVDKFTKVLLKHYFANSSNQNNKQIYLLEACKHIPITGNEKNFEPLYKFIIQALNNEDIILRLLGLEVSINLIKKVSKECPFINFMRNYLSNRLLKSSYPPENYLKQKLGKLIEIDTKTISTYADFCLEDTEKIPEIYLSNLKSATDWTVKRIQVDLLLEYALQNPRESGFYTAMHFCNILKVSAVEGVRNRAGDALVKIIPHLSFEQRNDVTIELLRALEIEGYRFAKYIPYYLGQAVLFLKPKELDEIINDLIIKNKSSNSSLNSLLLKTIGIAIRNYSKYRSLFEESEQSYSNRFIKMLGILLNGLVNYNNQVKQVAISIIGKDIFGSKEIPLFDKNRIFKLVSKKILTLTTDSEDDNLLLLSNSAGLNHIYRFISDYFFFKGEINLEAPKKIAFFPGTFDPFSISHKEMATEIRDLGFEVYLAVDEFSWSKQTLPNLIRRNIINMSIADELEIYLFPDDVQINLANPDNLRLLRSSFPQSEIYIVIGSDVIVNASSYQKNKSQDSIHTFSHIIFERKDSITSSDGNINLDLALKRLEGDILKLTLPDSYEAISSTQIRSYIDQNRDISSLIDPLAQKYIYEYGFYQAEPRYKSVMQSISIDVEVVDNITEDVILELSSVIRRNRQETEAYLKEIALKFKPRIILIRDINAENKIIGFSAFHWVRSNVLFHELKSSSVTEYVRENSVGRIVLIDGIFIDSACKLENLEQIILTETLTFSLSRDYNYAIFRNKLESYYSSNLIELLKLHGFQEIDSSENATPTLVVNMDSPCTLYLDIDSVIKEPYRTNLNVKKSILRSRKKLQQALCQLYPGHLVLSFDRNMIYETLTKKICSENNVPTTPTIPRELGDAMCVPFGNILKRYIVPNSVTKSLHTEKIFSPDLKEYKIGPYPYYLSLENQMKMLASFKRPIILVDDLLHKGYRIKALDPLLKNEDIKVQKIIVGLLSSRGKELMDIQDREVECAYYIPKIKVWFNESMMYPFMGGDALLREDYPQRNLIPSVNLILPYASPTFIKGTPNSAIYNMSEVCIENSIDILTTLENEYQDINERNLTLWHMGQVLNSPRCPDHGKDMDYDLNLTPSHYLRNDLELLGRLEYMITK